jgi:tRNA uridine 5-carboxymethylaminomethyl modification enzyme
MTYDFDIIVVGGGHAGVEAAAAGAHMGLRVLLCTLNKKMISNMPCNPHIGGSAKGIVVREIDALGGMMAIAADHHPLQIKMLNTGKARACSVYGASKIKKVIPLTCNLCWIKFLISPSKNAKWWTFSMMTIRVFGVKTREGESITSKAVIVTTGTYMNGRIISGRDVHPGGPDGEKPSIGLSEALAKMGLEIFRLKTGTPPRIKKSTIDFSKGEIQLRQR